MTAHLVPIRERFPNPTGLLARLALLEADCIDFRAELNRVIETPFGLPHFEPDDPIVYAGDETE